MMGFGHGWGYGMHGVFGGIAMILFWILIIIGIVYLVKNMHNNKINNNQPQKQKDNAVDIARKRYARGEINKEEFEQIKNVLEEED